MNTTRRLLLRGALPGATVWVAVAAGLLRPAAVWAAPASAPRAAGANASGLLHDLLGKQAALTGNLHLHVPDIAEDGANVFLEVSTTLPDVDGFVFFAERNPQQLVAAFWLDPAVVLPAIMTRIKLAQTSNVWVVARSRGQYFKAFKRVTVTVGGCGVGQN